MRDLLRAEIERTHRETPLGSLLNNTWFLVIALMLLIAGGVIWFRSADLSPDAHFQAGVQALGEPEGTAWLAARDLHFLPLLESDSDRWQNLVEPYLQQIEEYELRSKFKRKGLNRKQKAPASETERLLILAQRYEEIGDIPRAQEILTALNALLAGEPEKKNLYDFTQKRLKELKLKRDEFADHFALVESAMQRADRLVAENKRDEAQKIWSSIVTLYQSDAAAGEYVRRARKLLADDATQETTTGP